MFLLKLSNVFLFVPARGISKKSSLPIPFATYTLLNERMFTQAISTALRVVASLLGGLALLSGNSFGAKSDENGVALSFNRDIRPILADNCFACHGLDAKKRKADLRLDTADGAHTAIDGAFPIAKGAPEKSTVWMRIQSTDPDECMPPPESHKKLTLQQKEIIKRWIQQGGAYERHWAFEPLTTPPTPKPSPKSAKHKNAIDEFLAPQRSKAGLKEAPEADRATLIRRVAFTLTGLPPTVSAVDAFIADRSELAYETLVEKYITTPEFGEEMARHWLDVARYADTHGLHLDNEREMWAYRDWVVNAFNQNLPFDQFTVQQIAGDQLPNPTQDQITATGFSRCNVTTGEGGAISEEYRHLYAVERTSTVMQAWTGLTAGCAQCHDHKYDPLSTREFYSLYAFFFSAADPPMDGNISSTEPYQKRPTPTQSEALAKAKSAEVEALKTLDDAASKLTYTEPYIQAESTSEPVTQVFLDDIFPLASETRTTSRNPAVWITDPEFGAHSGRRVLRQASGQFTENVVQAGALPLTVPEAGECSVWVRLDPQSPPRGLSIQIQGRKVYWGDRAYSDGAKPENPEQDVNLGALPPLGVWSRLYFHLKTLELKPGTRIESIALQQNGGIAFWDAGTITGLLHSKDDPLVSLNQWWNAFPKKAKADNTDLPPSLLKILLAGPEKATDPADRKQVQDYYLGKICRNSPSAILALRTDWLAAKVNKESCSEAIHGTLVFRDLDAPLETFVAVRGQYDKHGERVTPDVPAVFPALKKDKPEGRATRLDLARWLVARDNPLTARVTVNRLWQQVFGIGLVKTSHDFGSQGEPPSHPELLDWLACIFRDSAWDVKGLLRLMLNSNAFRQSSVVSAELREQDPENRLLARGPRIRLDAEQIRDNALFVSGLLDSKKGGRGSLPYQPSNIWEPVGYANSNTRYYLQEHDSSLYRRSLYCFLKRTAPPPFMSTFDGPSREQSCVRRERTNTPMQALQLMNDVQHFEAARALAERVLTEGGTTDAGKIQWLFRVVLARTPDAQESNLLLAALQKQRTLYRNTPREASAVSHAGEAPPQNTAPAAETAAWTLLGNLVLNLDETVNRN